MTVTSSLPSQNVIGFPVTAVPFEAQVQQVIRWAQGGLSKVVCVANVHMLVEASWDQSLANILHGADLVTPDGMPLVWMVRLLRKTQQERVAGMDLMQAVCQQASEQGLSVYFLGSEQRVLDQMRYRLQREFPQLQVAGMDPLPMLSFPLTVDTEVVEKVNQSGASIVFVALGCPKQEKWMAAYHNQIQAVMLGVGGVFPLYAGLQQRAPEFIRSSGLEWLYRLVQEPRRLWKRYSKTIPPFIWLATKQLLQRPVPQRPIFTAPESGVDIITKELATSGRPLRR
ncbi:WecB/TagA/CpsF family glycosyltransferase [filamentous cyanobacterium LEGE 11480]|uniref:WecB/TagA/CpsF family glycosyltransferase n=1 Tax=Romeriopsis navalis LEGE 11480 TaxID=2777977 RepID=A0A928Z4R9_9CYAN|nr:WecB/TagA/CpsF family glycosyltransferase [Romeriopsis navalis]MBE9031307.1 WecB/TagA/CpsF family glycosyltransferase [Romeriopsis navalis LEGE 11480]